MIIRRLMPDDGEIWRDIRLEMLRTSPESFATSYADVCNRPVESFAEWLEQIHLFAAIESGIIGTAGWHPMEGSNLRHRGRVISVYVRPENRGQGVIDSLMNAILKDAKKSVVQLELDVLESNLAAIKAYQRNGFEMIGSTPRAVCKNGAYFRDLRMMGCLDA